MNVKKIAAVCKRAGEIRMLKAEGKTFAGTGAALYGVTPGGKVKTWENSFSRNAKVRSKTFHGIARAMAEQWG